MSSPQHVRRREACLILVVEDHTSARRFISQALRDAGFLTLEAASAAQGLDLLREYGDAVALAIIDMVMPGLSGLDLAVEMERSHAGVNVLFTSGHSSNIAIDGVAERYPERVLTKPFSVQELLTRVTALL